MNNKDFKDGRDFKEVNEASYEDVHSLRDCLLSWLVNPERKALEVNEMSRPPA